MASNNKGLAVGCWVAMGVTAFVFLGCGGLFLFLGWSVWNNPDVQRVVEISGAALDLANEAQNAPGAAELRAAGCEQAFVITPEMLERLITVIDADAGVQELPDFPVVSCAVRRPDRVQCPDLARTYMSAVHPPPAEVAITVQMQGQNQALCSGVYDASGGLVRELDEHERRYRQVGQTQ
jgi:hypothetical protein